MFEICCLLLKTIISTESGMNDVTNGFIMMSKGKTTVCLEIQQLWCNLQPNLICYITLGEETGTGFVFFLVFLLWIFAAYRLWIVWSSKLNFEKV